MTWYKRAKLETFEDRNKLNEKIRFFKKAVEVLAYLKKYVYQNAPHAKKTLKELTDGKIMSSFPKLRELMEYADEVALDSYKKFEKVCDEVISKFVSKVKELEKERSNFSKSLADKNKGKDNGK